MRIGFDARWYNDSGVGTYVAGLVPALACAGCDLVVYVDPDKPVPGLDKLAVKVVPVGVGRYSPFASIEFRRRAKQDKLDVFHSPFYVAPKLECPTVITVHDLIPFLFPIYPWMKQQMVKAGYRTGVCRATHIIADSQHTSSDLQKVLGVSPRRITAVHLAAERKVFSPCGSAEELERLDEKFGLRQPYFVVASAHNWRTKNLEGALKAVANARNQTDLKFQTAVYGSPQGIEALRSNDLWAELNICRVGYVERGELAMLFRHAHAFVMPSLYEGFGFPLVQAMAANAPVLASCTSCLPEIGGEAAAYVDPLSLAEMSAQLTRLLESPEERSRLARLGRAHAERYRWERCAKESLAFFREISGS